MLHLHQFPLLIFGIEEQLLHVDDLARLFSILVDIDLDGSWMRVV